MLGGKCSKHSKDMLIILLVVNMDDSEKLIPFLIRKVVNLGVLREYVIFLQLTIQQIKRQGWPQLFNGWFH